MDNPLNLQVPDDKVEQIHALARDIAYGAINKLWTSHLRVKETTDRGIWFDEGLRTTLEKKWGDIINYYFVHLLTNFGYLQRSDEIDLNNNSVVFFDVTQKAFALLEKPITPPSIFISYSRRESSALALLIEARLKIADKNVGIFIDKVIPPGASWHAHLEERVKASKYFICLIGKETLNSTYVQKEIDWAVAAGCTIISICHNGYMFDTSTRIELTSRQAIMIDKESADEYESALIKLLNSLGYATY
jgi:hypothetical protein